VLRVGHLDVVQMRSRVTQDERHRLALFDDELCDRLEILAVHRRGRAQHDHVGTGDCAPRVRCDVRNPRDRDAVAEADHQLGTHRDLATLAHDDTHQVGAVIARRHEVEDAHTAGRSRETRFENQRVVTIATRDFHICRLRHEQPATVLGSAEQCRETGIGIEAGPAQPVDRSIEADQRCALAVADHRVVFDVQRHCRLS
jgi:hypothetical protein